MLCRDVFFILERLFAVCAVCADGYADGSGYTCSECNGARRMSTIGIAIALLVVAAALVTTSVSYLGSSKEVSTVEGLKSMCLARLEGSILSHGLKIVIVSWQIVSEASTAPLLFMSIFYVRPEPWRQGAPPLFLSGVPAFFVEARHALAAELGPGWGEMTARRASVRQCRLQ